MISFNDFAMRRGPRLLLAGVSLTLQAGWRVGVVGRNGSGKSSLFAAIQGELEADAGKLERPAGLRIASVAQEMPALSESALDYVIGGDPLLARMLATAASAEADADYEAAAVAHQQLADLDGYDAGARAGRLLHGLGFPGDSHDRPVAAFSGGWRARLNLARALMTPSDLLLLDEPTNHLDLDALLWLEQWLVRRAGTLLVISHDREFLDGVSTHTLHLHDGRARLHPGGYSEFEAQRAEQLRQQQLEFEKERSERARLQAFIDRFRAKATKARQAQSRVRRLERLAGTQAVRLERALQVHFEDPPSQPLSLLRLRDARCGYVDSTQAEDRIDILPHGAIPPGSNVVLSQVDLGLEAGDRIGLLGPNGAGKSTLVKTLVGSLPLLSGERTEHPDVRIGYFAQHAVERLEAGTSPIEHLRRLAPEEGEQVLRDFLARWHFHGERVFESVDGFSGGERARLALGLLAWQRPNLLLLDEPTNHLDLEMREALAEALVDFPGALVVVSHDRHLMGLVCDRFWRIADGQAVPFDGALEDYAAWLRARNSDEAAGRAAQTARRPARAVVATQRPDPAVARRLRRIEARLETIEAARAELERELADPDLYASRGREHVEALGHEQARLAREQEALETEWLELA